MAYENIKIEKTAPLADLVLNRPDKINALSRATIRELIQAFGELGDDSETRVIILRAEGKHFCAGHDLSEMVDGKTAHYQKIFEDCCRLMNLMHELPKPIVAQVHGIATAAGCQLVAAADLAVAEENASFGTPGVKIGLFCSTPAVPLVRAVGRKRALEMLLTGRMVPAAEAEDWGLINRVVPADQLAEETRDLARSIAQASPLTLEIGKKTFYNQIDDREEVAYDIAQNSMTASLTTDDAQEGIKAFLEKRKPAWKGQ